MSSMYILHVHWEALKQVSYNPFVPNTPFLYPPENIRKSLGFLFSGGRERVHWEQMGSPIWLFKRFWVQILVISIL